MGGLTMLICPFCFAWTFSIDAAIDAGWKPNFWIGGHCVDHPVCGECIARHCDFWNGEAELRAGVPIPVVDRN
jgi:hypothetical protein